MTHEYNLIAKDAAAEVTAGTDAGLCEQVKEVGHPYQKHAPFVRPPGAGEGNMLLSFGWEEELSPLSL